MFGISKFSVTYTLLSKEVIKILISSYSDYHVVSSKEATRKRASGQAEVCRWVMILFIGFFTALVAFGIDEGIV